MKGHAVRVRVRVTWILTLHPQMHPLYERELELEEEAEGVEDEGEGEGEGEGGGGEVREGEEEGGEEKPVVQVYSCLQWVRFTMHVIYTQSTQVQ